MPDDEPTPTGNDRNWWRPGSDRALMKHMVGPWGEYIYRLSCQRCEVNWLEIPDISSHPRCFACGRFVPLSKMYRDERERLRLKRAQAKRLSGSG